MRMYKIFLLNQIFCYIVFTFSFSIDKCGISDRYVVHHVKIHTNCKFLRGLKCTANIYTVYPKSNMMPKCMAGQ